MPWIFLVLFSLLSPAIAEGASCFDQAGNQYKVSPLLLRAIAKQESGMRDEIIHVNKDGTRDFGLMQINERWLSHLNQFGISKERLMEPCQNIHVSAYILRLLFNKHGENWKAIGHYNAAHPVKAAKYAWAIHKKINNPEDSKEMVRR